MTASDIVKKYISFFEERGHKRIANAPLVPINDPTTLFTGSGMQSLLPYLLGEPHPQGTRLVNIQNCFRAQDIEEIGDNRHTTFFRMMGNWSLGDYFKKEQLPWFWEFLTKELGLSPEKLYVTVFEGSKDAPRDTESAEILTKILTDAGLDPKERIHHYGVERNWWSRSGIPEKMPPGEPGGPDSEVFYEFTSVKHDKKYGEECHPNCECGRFMEIGNSVFMQYIKQEDGSFRELPKKNVDFGGGLERLAAVTKDNPDVFTSDLYAGIIQEIEKATEKNYKDDTNKIPMRVIADHLKAAIFLMLAGVTPSNKEQGYVLRRLLRRAAVKMHKLGGGLTPVSFQTIADRGVLAIEERIDETINRAKARDIIFPIIDDEMSRFAKTLDKGLKEVERNINHLDDVAFNVYQSHGFPFEIIQELAKERGKTVSREKFEEQLRKHQELSRTASAGMFRGGLADHSERTIMGHTATHLLHQALRDVLGSHVHQTGSNITTERIRFDFNYDKRLTDQDIYCIEGIVNQKIQENLPVHFELIPTDKAHKMGAIGLFMDTYGDKSKIYFIGDMTKSHKDAYSIEFCGGPHVDFTGKLKSVKIVKQE
ncbi:MAG: alanine--tRNA ligase, partial [Candidatus Levybacteria bacterium]|nr:alanine--tRNA ligase [Candidatus Levybacteria bacterium]